MFQFTYRSGQLRSKTDLKESEESKENKEKAHWVNIG